jgi:pimeloyl-ACP methyl ester carboxylesterase
MTADPIDRRSVLSRIAGTVAMTAAATTSGDKALAAGSRPDSTAPQPDGAPVSQATPTISVESGYADVNGLEMYYEIHGSGGHPLVLLHGGLVTIDLIFGQLLPVLAQNRQVIAVELQGHGHTALGDRSMSYEQMADDTVALMDAIGVANADILGYSLGGGVALQIAIRRPEVVRKLVIASAPFRTEGWAPEILGSMAALNAEAAAAMVETPLYQAYVSVAPNTDDWPRLVTEVGQLVTGQPYDWSAEVAAITAPILFIYGDADSVQADHMLDFFQLLGGGVVGDLGQVANVQLAVLPGTAHSAVFFRTDLLLAIIPPFLDAPMPDAT